MDNKIINQKKIHEEDWRIIKKSYSDLEKKKHIAERIKILVRLIKKNKPKKILDIGCGIGHLMYQIKKNKIKIEQSTGLDISEIAIKKAKKVYDKAYVLNIDQKDLPEKENSFDMIVCSEVLEHLYDVNHCLKEIVRVLSPDGIVIITVPNFAYIEYRILSFLGIVPKIIREQRHLSAFNIKILKEECKKAGLEVIKSSAFGARLRILNIKLFKYLLLNTLIIIAKKKKSRRKK